MKTHLPMPMQGACQPETLYQVLLWAESHHDSVEHAAQHLTGVPTDNDLRYHLDKFEAMTTVEHQVNAALQSRLKTMRSFIHQVIERHFPLVRAVYLSMAA